MTTAPDRGARLVGAALVEHLYPFNDRLRQQAQVWRVPAADAFLVSSWDLVTEAAGR
jgi:cytochrome P450 family 144